MAVKFCNIILPDFNKVSELINNTSQISNFGNLYWQLKKKLIDYFQLDNDHTVVITSSGHTALMTAFAVLKSSTILIPSYTFTSTLQAARLQRMHTLIVDVDLSTGILPINILDKYKGIINTVVVVCPLSCVPPDLHLYHQWCKLNKKLLIIDGAATFGSIGPHYNYGDAYCISFHATKPFPVGECGCIICKKSMEEQMIQYTKFGLDTNKKMVGPGINAKVSEYTCAIALSLLEKIDTHIERRKYITALYKQELSVDSLPSIEDTVYASFPIYIQDEERRNRIRAALSSYQIDTLQYYIPLNNAINANKLYNTNICLPCHSNMTDTDIETIIGVVHGKV